MPQSFFPDATPAAPTPAPSTGASFFPREESPDPLRDSLSAGLKASADQAARVFTLQRQTGLPAEFVQQNLEDLEHRTRMKGFDAEQFRQRSPMLAQWLQEHPQHAAVAQDDLGPLAALERGLHAARYVSGAASAALTSAVSSTVGVAQAGAELFHQSAAGQALARRERPQHEELRHAVGKHNGRRDGEPG